MGTVIVYDKNGHPRVSEEVAFVIGISIASSYFAVIS
jgi:hypothetical protein